MTGDTLNKRSYVKVYLRNREILIRGSGGGGEEEEMEEEEGMEED